MTVAYLDASAVVKLCLTEPETEALTDHLRAYRRTISSDLTLIEATRAVVRAIGPEGLAQATAICRRLDLMAIDRSIVERARSIEPDGLRSLDAVHLASALAPRVAPVLVAYDDRLLEAAAAHGLVTVSPGR